MLNLSKPIVMLFLTLPVLLLCSCDYRALAKENNELEKRKAELSANLKTLTDNLAENPDDSVSLLAQAKVKLNLVEKKREELTLSKAKLSRQHELLIKKNIENQRDFIIK